MRNPLQEQLLKAGLVKKSQVAQVAREQAKQRHGKAAPAPTAEQVEAERLRLEKAERDRALAAERNAQARLQEQRAQARQIVQQNQVRAEGEIAYHFADSGAIKTIWINAPLRAQLASGSLVIVRHDQGYALIPRAAAEKVYARDPAMVVLDHARSSTDGSDSDDEYYQRFPVPDDLSW
ncbi:DUF2058 domain-containing protein [Pseudoxanthomonas wuyuanensis]|uniref:Nucleoprotein/polynucleotide-associated enzyme n=1 Tax=Pseudoxanthomonas wuyuanensis TaxID=1073196 RepID=A0A286CWU0_9GAMM|nr:DUF2058 domain-containing protein [Pseudoxanthomonas wuyuanensis]KAF1720890.1 DUF2058 domain-containing protein [Pseudoxanthomonas wuyuanensis]SOD50870.1 hypothetical protein SAMN06296416_101349 [Pseudoxanthomonas wuyuanensis]